MHNSIVHEMTENFLLDDFQILGRKYGVFCIKRRNLRYTLNFFANVLFGPKRYPHGLISNWRTYKRMKRKVNELFFHTCFTDCENFPCLEH